MMDDEVRRIGTLERAAGDVKEVPAARLAEARAQELSVFGAAAYANALRILDRPRA